MQRLTTITVPVEVAELVSELQANDFTGEMVVHWLRGEIAIVKHTHTLHIAKRLTTVERSA